MGEKETRKGRTKTAQTQLQSKRMGVFPKREVDKKMCWKQIVVLPVLCTFSPVLAVPGRDEELGGLQGQRKNETASLDRKE